jgi:hypothetical protein
VRAAYCGSCACRSGHTPEPKEVAKVGRWTLMRSQVWQPHKVGKEPEADPARPGEAITTSYGLRGTVVLGAAVQLQVRRVEPT